MTNNSNNFLTEKITKFVILNIFDWKIWSNIEIAIEMKMVLMKNGKYLTVRPFSSIGNCSKGNHLDCPPVVVSCPPFVVVGFVTTKKRGKRRNKRTKGTNDQGWVERSMIRIHITLKIVLSKLIFIYALTCPRSILKHVKSDFNYCEFSKTFEILFWWK